MRILLAALVSVVLVWTTGCAVGIRTFKSNAGNPELKQSLKDVRFTYQTGQTDKAELRLALERVLIESYNVQDIQPLQKGTSHETDDRVVITAAVMPEPTSNWQDICMGISLFSFSVIPCVYDQHRDIFLRATRKNMIVSEKTFRVVERSYNWLPLSLASPDYVFFLIDGNEIGQQAEKVALYNNIMKDFLSEVGRSLERQPL